MDTYLFVANDTEDLRISSSGGAFISLAKELLKIGGVIYGVAQVEDKFAFTRASTITEVRQQCGSKYIEIPLGHTISLIKNDLRNGTWVLFCGTPCQNAALHVSIESNLRKHLIQIDFICHGTVKHQFWQEYEREFAIDTARKISFRDKEHGGNRGTALTYYNKEGGFVHDDCFTYFFAKNYLLSDRCYRCKFKGENRISDLTISDAWCLKTMKVKGFDLSKGASLLVVRNPRILDLIRKHGKTQEVSFIQSLYFGENPAYYSAPSRPNDLDKVHKRIEDEGFRRACAHYAQEQLKAHTPRISTRVKSIARRLLSKALRPLTKRHTINKCLYDVVIVTIPGYYNFGNRLQNFALHYFLSNNGISSVNYYHSNPSNAHASKAIIAACRKYETEIYVGTESPSPNKCYLFGSDQLWNYQYFSAKGLIENLGWNFRDDAPMISYAASFGTTNIEREFLGIYQHCLRRFSSIGVRESSSTKSLSEIGISAHLNADPCLLLSSEQWNAVIRKRAKSTPPRTHYALLHLFFEKEKIKETLPTDIYYLDLLCQERFNQINHFDFIQAIRDAQFIVTDSYHCLIFSIIFAKKVQIYFKPDGLGTEERIKTICSFFGITPISGETIDFGSQKYENLNSFIAESKDFLLSSIGKEK